MMVMPKPPPKPKCIPGKEQNEMMDMTVQWSVAKPVTAVVSVPDDSTPEERHKAALHAMQAYTPGDARIVRGTAIWNTPDGQFGGVLA
jgi:regulator of protease activity HflC (stomatin/prohibitin superfamily)